MNRSSSTHHPLIPWAVSALIVILLILVNLIAQEWKMRFDLTEDGIYTLSEDSQGVLKRVHQPLHIKLFFSEDLPLRFQPLQTFVRDLVDEYRAAAPEFIHVQQMDPKTDEALAREAYALGVRETKANVMQESRMEIANVWFGIALVMGDRSEALPTVPTPDNLELELTRAMVRLLRPERPRIAFLGPPNQPQASPPLRGHDFESDMKPLAAELATLFQLESMPWKPDLTLNLDDTDAVVCWGLHQFTQPQLDSLEEAFRNGLPFILLTSGVDVDTYTLRASEIPPSPADALFSKLGFQLQRNLVCDNNCQIIKHTASDGTEVYKDYPLFPLITPEMKGFNPEFEPTTRLNNQLLPFVSELSPTSACEAMRTDFIARTSRQSWLQERRFQLDPEQVPGPTSFASYVVGLELQGHLDAHREGPEIHGVVLGTHHVLGQYINPSNLVWMSNTLNHLTGADSLSGIPRKESAFRPIREMEYREKRLIQWIVLLAAPVLVAIPGLFRTLLRGRRRKKYAPIEDSISEDSP